MKDKDLRKLQASIDYVITELALISKGQFIMSQELEALRTQVENATTVMDSAAALIGGLAQKIEELKDDPVALQALADSLGAESAELAAAVQANTPPAPQPDEPASDEA